MEKLHESKAFQDKIIDILKENINDKLYKNRDEFEKHLKNIFKDIKLTNGLKKAILMELSKRDETADYCIKGRKKKQILI
ncbi:hypothetical protein NSA23_05375 [Anaerosalibacter massiliensis]|uniref:Uncharacterized protein n=1 Tax=Anaerosalibacter massiliensis TaxID=1347392 RepID=A0A9X2S6W7_9FIRM|nr:hypothetical protein [Anaerosalibacter massiliensis]MCR2043546.1 hypothetical protein [Anaerosalibacter massiliensis]